MRIQNGVGTADEVTVWGRKGNRNGGKPPFLQVDPDDREREEAEDLIRKAWRQYISLYYEGIPKRLLKLFFDVRIFDERTKHGYSENAVYFVRRQKPGRG